MNGRVAVEFEQGLDIGMESDEVVARYAQEPIGRMLVLGRCFQWCRDTFVSMGGIAGVDIDEPFRQHGIGHLMMQQAVAHSRTQGHVCSGVSTGTVNVARRLHSGAGYVHVFSMQGYVRQPRRRRTKLPQRLRVRTYEAGDEQMLVQLRSQTRSECFGCLKPDPSRWLHMRRVTLDTDPESVLVTLEDGRTVGYASYFQHWFGLACDIHVGECRRRLQVGRALLSRLETRLDARGCRQAVFSATQDETLVRWLLEGEGYRPGIDRVFQVNILDLDGLLCSLRGALETRISESPLPEWTGTLHMKTEKCEGIVAIGADPGRSTITVTASRKTLAQVLCGRLSGWEAYLRGDLDVDADLDAHTPALLQALFPKVPCCHPIDEWW